MDTQHVGDLSFVTTAIARLFDIQRQQPLEVRNDLWLRKFEIGIHERLYRILCFGNRPATALPRHDMNQNIMCRLTPGFTGLARRH